MVRDASGWPAVMYGTSARRRTLASSAKRRSIIPTGDAEITSDEVVTDPDAISFRILSLDDGAKEDAVVVAIRQIDQRSRMCHVALRVADDTDDRPGQHVRQWTRRVNDTQLEGIEHDQRAHRIDAGQIDECLHDDRVHAAMPILPHLEHDLRRRERHRLIRAP